MDLSGFALVANQEDPITDLEDDFDEDEWFNALTQTDSVKTTYPRIIEKIPEGTKFEELIKEYSQFGPIKVKLCKYYPNEKKITIHYKTREGQTNSMLYGGLLGTPRSLVLSRETCTFYRAFFRTVNSRLNEEYIKRQIKATKGIEISSITNTQKTNGISIYANNMEDWIKLGKGKIELTNNNFLIPDRTCFNTNDINLSKFYLRLCKTDQDDTSKLPKIKDSLIPSFIKKKLKIDVMLFGRQHDPNTNLTKSLAFFFVPSSDEQRLSSANIKFEIKPTSSLRTRSRNDQGN